MWTKLRPKPGLLPPQHDPARAVALNKLMMFVAAIYPTFTFGDTPEDWTEPSGAAYTLRERLDARKAELWHRFEAEANPAPFLFGARPTAIDLYAAVMTQWRPKWAWFEANTPKIASAARAVAAHPKLATIMAHHYEG